VSLRALLFLLDGTTFNPYTNPEHHNIHRHRQTHG